LNHDSIGGNIDAWGPVSHGKLLEEIFTQDSINRKPKAIKV
jgi:hypothetical protein